MDEIVNPIGRFLEWSFGILEWMGDMPWILMMWGGFIGTAYWCMRQMKYNKEAEANGTLK